MTELIACISLGKGTWSEVFKLMSLAQFDRIFLIVNNIVFEKLKEDFKTESIKIDNTNVILINPNDSIDKIINDIYSSLKYQNIGFDVAVNISSGIGKEHMALISSVLKLGVGLRFVSIKNNELVEL